MLNAVRIRNLRGFGDSDSNPYVDLKPVTVLVGRNSSGKSSFLRTFPMLRQSFEAKTIGPILWYGRYVDFGAYSEVKSNLTDNEIIYFDFKINLNLPNENDYWMSEFFLEDFKSNIKSTEIDVSIGVSEVNNNTVAKSVSIKIPNIEIRLEFLEGDACQLYVNNEEYELDGKLGYMVSDDIIPEVGFYHDFKRKGVAFRRWDNDYLSNFFSKLIFEEIRGLFHKNTHDSKVKEGIDHVLAFDKDELISSLNSYYKTSNYFTANLKKTKNIDRVRLLKLFVCKGLPTLISYINRDLKSVFTEVRYIAPLRATAERYYRYQDLKVDEIDHTGSNLAMVLKSFDARSRREFDKWVSDNFGFKLRVEEGGLHYALKVQLDSEKYEYNINDMGFGFSQILPIVTSIWMEMSKNKGVRRNLGRRRQIIFTIEQPELHLHPEYQHRVAIMFCKVVSYMREKGVNISIVFETHSKTMVDTLGDCIEEGVIDSNLVGINVFEKDPESGETALKFSEFDASGILENWPVGFFSGRGL